MSASLRKAYIGWSMILVMVLLTNCSLSRSGENEGGAARASGEAVDVRAPDPSSGSMQAAQEVPEETSELSIEEAVLVYLELLRTGSIDELVEQTHDGYFRAQIISECGEPPFPEPEEVVVENDEEMLRNWFEKTAGSWTDCDREGADGPGSRPEGCRWDNPLRIVSPELAPIECEEGCCEMGAPGLHNTPFLTDICFEEGVVTELTIHDGC